MSENSKKYDEEKEPIGGSEDDKEGLPWECSIWFVCFGLVGCLTSIGFTIALAVLKLGATLWFVYTSFWICTLLMLIGFCCGILRVIITKIRRTIKAKRKIMDKEAQIEEGHTAEAKEN